MTDREQYVDRVLHVITVAMVKAFCARALQRGDTIEQVNERLAFGYMPHLEQWRVQARSDLLRQTDVPTAPTTTTLQ